MPSDVITEAYFEAPCHSPTAHCDNRLAQHATQSQADIAQGVHCLECHIIVGMCWFLQEPSQQAHAITLFVSGVVTTGHFPHQCIQALCEIQALSKPPPLQQFKKH